MAFLTGNVRVQVVVPPGMITVSPFLAEPITAATSDSDALFALSVVAPAKRARARTSVAESETRAVMRGAGVEQQTFGSPLEC